MSKTVKIFFLLALLTYSIASASDYSVLTRQQMQQLDSGRIVSPVRILEDSGILLISESRAGGHYNLVWTSSRWKPTGKTSLPLRSVDYVASDQTGRNIVAYSQERYSFLKLNRRARNWQVFASQQGAQPGFALYGGRKSRLFYSNNSLFAVGYFYDKTGEYLSEWVVRIHPDRKGEEVFERIFELSTPPSETLKYFPDANEIKLLDINNNTAVFGLFRGNRGCILSYDLETKEFLPIDYFDRMVNFSLSDSGNLCAYVIQPQGSDYQGVLFIYNLKKRQPVKCVPGIYFNPVFDQQEKKIAVGYYDIITNRLRLSRIDLIPIETDETSTITVPGGENLHNWTFSGRNHLHIFAGKEIYRYNIR
jgi:hypothetical protein